MTLSCSLVPLAPSLSHLRAITIVLSLLLSLSLPLLPSVPSSLFLIHGCIHTAASVCLPMTFLEPKSLLFMFVSEWKTLDLSETTYTARHTTVCSSSFAHIKATHSEAKHHNPQSTNDVCVRSNLHIQQETTSAGSGWTLFYS